MQITYINGQRLKLALLAGARQLAEHASFLNRINVFPVPDGDTGTNMAGTVQAIAAALSARSNLTLGAAARAAADSALQGARGNSGAILAQFFQGLAEELEREVRITTRDFAQAVRKAVKSTYGALSKPREGTILTVLTDWGNALHRVSQRTDDFLELLKTTIQDARASLERTKTMLPELRKAGVVDAGAQGWVHILEGIIQFISHGKIREFEGGRTGAELEGSEELIEIPMDSGESSQFRYCTECMLEGETLDLPAIRESLAPLGDSIVVAGSSRRAKVHIHTNDPARAFHTLEAHSRVTSQKADDMELQRSLTANPPACALLVDSACDFPEAQRLALRVERVPLTVAVNGADYLDRDGLSSKDFYERMRLPGVELTTSQPSDAAFRRKLDILTGAAKEVVYLGLSAPLSGTLEAGRRAAAASKHPDRIRVIDSKSISVSLALLARVAARAAAAGASADEVEEIVLRLRSKTRLLVAVPDLTGLIKSGRLKGIKGLAARAFGFRPVITVDADGRAASTGLYIGAGNGKTALVKMLRKYLPGPSEQVTALPLEVLIGHADAPSEADALAEMIASEFRLDRKPDIVDVSPALALHAGPGALALGFIIPDRDSP